MKIAAITDDGQTISMHFGRAQYYLICTVENGEITAPLIIEALRKAGHVVTRLSLTKPTLNEVYLQYTGRSMRDAEESGYSLHAKRMMMARRRH